jgi:Deoxyribonuclease NucA/NucB
VDTIEALKQQRRDEARLQREWLARTRSQPFHHYPYICDDGLLLGAATQIAKMARDSEGRPRLQIEGNEERILALLSLAYGKAISTRAVKFIKRASKQWNKGEKAIAHFELAFARLPRFEAREDAFRLFCVDGLFKIGVSPQWLMRYHGLETVEIDLLKYSPDQPRVPVGSGRESGRWTSGGGGNGTQPPSRTSVPSSNEVMSDVSPDPIRPGQQYAQNGPPRWWPPGIRIRPFESGGGPAYRGGNSYSFDSRRIIAPNEEVAPAERPIPAPQPTTPSPTTSEADVARTIEISPERFGQAAEHARDAINAGYPDVLTIERTGRNANRAAATNGLETVPGLQLDEYPPAMFKEGGAGASVRAINPHDNMSLGAYIGNCCRRLPNGARVKLRIGE